MVEFPHAEKPPAAPKPPRKKLGRNQWFGVLALAVPFGFATYFVLTGRADPVWWGGFVQLQVPMVLGIILGASATVKLRGAGAPQQ